MKKRFISVALACFVAMHGLSAFATVVKVKDKVNTAGRESVSTTAPTTKRGPLPLNSIYELAGAYKNQTVSAPRLAKSKANTTVTSNVEGYAISYTDESFVPGWYDINTTNGSMDIKYDFQQMNAGFLRDDILYGCSSQSFWGMLVANYYIGYRISDGSQVISGGFANELNEVMISCAYDKEADKVYAYTYNADASGMMFQSLDPQTMMFTTLNESIGFDQFEVRGMAYNPIDKNIYAVLADGQIVVVNRADGSVTSKAELDIAMSSQFPLGFVYSPKDNGFILTSISEDAEPVSSIYRIDPTSFEATKIKDFDAACIVPVLVSQTVVAAPNTPAAVTFSKFNFVNGATTGTVSATLPTVSTEGTALTGDVTLHVLVDGDKEFTVVGKAGELATANVSTTAGTHEFKLWASTSATTAGPRITEYTYVGLDTPQAPYINSTAVSDDNLTITIGWQAPTEGDNGGYVDPNDLTYTIYLLTDDEENPWKLLKEGQTERSFTYTLPSANEPLQVTKLAVNAESKAGKGEYSSAGYAMLGKPLTMPIVEEFEGDNYTYDMMLIESRKDGQNYVGGFTLTDANQVITSLPQGTTAIIGHNTGAAVAGIGELSTSKFNTIDAHNPVVKTSYFSHDNMPDVQIWARTADTEKVIGTINGSSSNSWETSTIELPAEFLNKKWVGISYRCLYPTTQTKYFILNGYTYIDPVEKDLAVRLLKGDTDLRIGAEGSYSAEVANYGTENATFSEIKCEITNNDRLVGTVNIPCQETTLAPGQKAKFEFKHVADAGMVGSSELKFTVVSDDVNPGNDSATLIVNVSAGTSSVVTDLDASLDESTSSVYLTWGNPTSVYNPEVEDFEACEDWEKGSRIGRFTNIDGDEFYTAAFTDYVGKYDGSKGEPKGFQVFNWYAVRSADQMWSSLMAHSGYREVVAVCPWNWDNKSYPADDWLISPEIQPGSTVSFQLGISSDQKNGETFDILSSSTTDNREAFTKVVKTVTKNTLGYEEVTVTLPDDAKYFAIHYNNDYGSSIIIDDIAYSAAYAPEVIGFNIYRNGELVAEKVTGNDYTDTNVACDRVHTYNVAVVLKDGDHEYEQPFSNDAVIMWSGIESILVDGNAPVAVYTVDGIKVANSVNNLPAGIYIVKTGNKVAKVRINK